MILALNKTGRFFFSRNDGLLAFVQIAQPTFSFSFFFFLILNFSCLFFLSEAYEISGSKVGETETKDSWTHLQKSPCQLLIELRFYPCFLHCHYRIENHPHHLLIVVDWNSSYYNQWFQILNSVDHPIPEFLSGSPFHWTAE